MGDMPKDESVNVSVLVDARNQYLEHLVRQCTEPLFLLFQRYRDDAEALLRADKAPGMSTVTEVFVALMRELPSWDDEVVAGEAAFVLQRVPACMELLERVLLGNSTILKSLGGGSDSTDVVLPDLTTFVHRALVAGSAAFLDDPDLVLGQGRRREALKEVEHALHRAVEALVPVEEFLKKRETNQPEDSSLGEGEEDEEDEQHVDAVSGTPGMEQTRTIPVTVPPEAAASAFAPGPSPPEDPAQDDDW